MLPTDVDTWFGGGAAIVTSVERDSSGLDAQSYGAFAQTELDFRLESGQVYFRLDFDLQTVASGPGNTTAGYNTYPLWAELDQSVKFGPPEWAMLQLNLDPIKLRLGIMGHAIGFEDLESWNTYFPTKSTSYTLLPGRMAGVETAFTLGSGYDLFAFAGCDLDWGGCIAWDDDGDGVNDHESGDGLLGGFGVTTLQDYYGTWSGVALYPTINYYVAGIAVEFYPLDAFSIVVDGDTGLVGLEDEEGELKHNFFLTGGLTVNVLPSEVVHPMFRVNGLVDPDDAAWGGSFPTLSASAGLSTSPFTGFKISVEGKAARYGDDIVPGLYTSISLARPEPPPYSAKYPE